MAKSRTIDQAELPSTLQKWANRAYFHLKRQTSDTSYNHTDPNRGATAHVVPSSKIIASRGPGTHHYYYGEKSTSDERVAELLSTIVDEKFSASDVYIVADLTEPADYAQVINYALRNELVSEINYAPYKLQITRGEGDFSVDKNGVCEIKTGFACSSIKATHPTKREHHFRATVFNPEWMRLLANDNSPHQRPLQEKILQAFNAAYAENKFILIHCHAGQRRTACLVFLLTFMKHLMENPAYADQLRHELAKEKTTAANINDALKPALELVKRMRSVRDFEIEGHELIHLIHQAARLNALQKTHAPTISSSTGATKETVSPVKTTTTESPSVSQNVTMAITSVGPASTRATLFNETSLQRLAPVITTPEPRSSIQQPSRSSSH